MRAKMSPQNEGLNRVLTSDAYTEGAKRCAQWQYAQMAPMGAFWTAIWTAIQLADDENLDRLELAFPEDVFAYATFMSGELIERWKADGLRL